MFPHTMFRTCLRGIYSCQWKQDRTGQKRSCCWFSFLTIVSVLALSWMYFCFIAYNDHTDVNEEAFKKTKKWVNWYVIMLVLSSAFGVYFFFLMVFGLFHFAVREPLDLHWLHKVFLFLGLIFVMFGTTGICLKWKKELPTLLMSIRATGPFLQLGALVALVLISWLVFQSFHRASTAACKVLMMTVFLLVSVAVFLCPLLLASFSPCILEHLPPKPALVGHRGAPMLAPENTMMSFEKSFNCGVLAYESDVQLSNDNQPFLMHDNEKNFLLRTTDVKEKFPSRYQNNYSDFSLEEIKTLNAGKWFLRTDPFLTVSSMSGPDRKRVENQTVPTLSELLVLAKQTNVSIIFDLKNQNESADFYHSADFYTVETIRKSGISPEQIWWLPSQHRHNVRKIEPRFRQVYGSEHEMRKESGRHLNLNYNALNPDQIRSLRKENISVNLWVVSERWLFSLLWCAGASSVTTNACHVLRDMNKPDWHLEPKTYRIIWISADIIALILILIVFIWLRLRSRDFLYRETGHSDENEMMRISNSITPP